MVGLVDVRNAPLKLGNRENERTKSSQQLIARRPESECTYVPQQAAGQPVADRR